VAPISLRKVPRKPRRDLLKPKTRPGLVVADFGEELVVCEPSPGHSQIHYLNPSAATVFRLCDGTGTPTELAADIADAYGLPIKQVERDVVKLVRTFRRQGLLTVKPVVRKRPADHDHEHDHEHEHIDATPDERQRIRREVPENE
jgi:hypothetical protein